MGATAAQYPPKLAAGNVFDGYEVLTVLSRASHTMVFAAHDPRSGQDVIIKHCNDESGLLHREAQVLAKISHPNVATLIRCGTVGTGIYLVLALVAGKSLTQLLRENSEPAEADIVAALSQLADALGATHAAGFIHRDLKPSNVVVRPDGTTVLIDFGAAATAAETAEQASSTLTPGYAAPEQYELDGQEGTWTDIYALGAIGYRMVTGETPPDAPQRCREDTLRPARQAARNRFSDRLLEAIDDALQLDRLARPRSAKAFRALLARQSVGTVSGSVSKNEEPTRRVERLRSLRPAQMVPAEAATRPHRHRPRVVRATGLVLAAAILLTGIFFSWRAPTRDIRDSWVVDPSGLGDATTISEALRAAPDGATINVMPGEYRETLVLDRPVYLIGIDGGDGALILPSSGPCILGTASHGLVRGFRFGAETGNSSRSCIVLTGSGIAIENNSITARPGPAIIVRGEAQPLIRNNKISQIDGPGIVVEAGASALLIANEIALTTRPAIVASDGAQPTISRNTISETQQAGVLFQSGSAGLMLDNDILASQASGVEIRGAASPVIRRNRIQAGRQAGIYAYAGAGGQIVDNAITDNVFSGVILDGASPLLRGNEIQDNAEHGILIMNNSKSHVLDNTVSGNGGYGIAVSFEAEPRIEDNRLSGNEDPQTQYGILPNG